MDAISDFSAANGLNDALVSNLEKPKGAATLVAFEVTLVVVCIPLGRVQRVGYDDISMSTELYCKEFMYS
jgi:hypothetical protein